MTPPIDSVAWTTTAASPLGMTSRRRIFQLGRPAVFAASTYCCSRIENTSERITRA